MRASDTAESGIEASDASAEQQRIRRLRRNIEECEAELQSVGTNIASDTGIDPPVDLCLCGRLGSIVLLEETKLAVDQLCQTIDKLQLYLSTMTADVSEHRNFVEQQQRIHRALQASVQAHEPEISASARECSRLSLETDALHEKIFRFMDKRGGTAIGALVEMLDATEMQRRIFAAAVL